MIFFMIILYILSITGLIFISISAILSIGASKRSESYKLVGYTWLWIAWMITLLWSFTQMFS